MTDHHGSPSVDPVSPLVPAALVGALVPLAGCPGPEDPDCSAEINAAMLPDPPEDIGDIPHIVEVRWLSADTLELQYSEPLAAPNQPLAPYRFRLMNWNLTTNVYTYYGSASDDCTVYTQYSPVRQGGNFPSDLWQAPEDASVLRLRMNAPVTCTAQSGARTGLALFYTNDAAPVEAPTVMDLDGNPMPDLGPSWAVTAIRDCAASYAGGGSPGYYYYYAPTCSQLFSTVAGSFPVLDELLEIPCPPA